MTEQHDILHSRRIYNKWVANETLEDFALRYTAERARRWSGAWVANTALGTVSFLALEAIGGAIMLSYGFSNAVWAILVVGSLIFLTGLPICYHAAKAGVDIDLLTRGAGFGYIGSTISSLIYASFTFIFFALEAAIMAMALVLLLEIPLSVAYAISALIVIPLVTHGISIISRFQVWTQPIWIVLQLAPFIYLALNPHDIMTQWHAFTGQSGHADGHFDLLLFGAAAAVIFPLMAQTGEQVDFLRFLPKQRTPSAAWWLALIVAGPGWVIVGILKLMIGTFLVVLALNAGTPLQLADDPAHMYLVLFESLTQHPQLALILVGIFVVVSQLKINVTNAYAGSLAWSNFFSRVTHSHPGRVVWVVFNVLIALLLMQLGLYHTFEHILNSYASLVVAWVGTLVADLVINKPLGLRPARMEFKRSHLYDINPVGVGSMLCASGLGISAHLGVFGPYPQALAPFIALLTPFILAPLMAYATQGRYYLARQDQIPRQASTTTLTCRVCEHRFDREDMGYCPAYQGHICSLCCALDSRCHDQCRPHAHLTAQLERVLSGWLPKRWQLGLRSVTAHFVMIFVAVSLLLGGILALVYYSSLQQVPPISAAQLLWQVFFLLCIISGILVWLYVLAENSKRVALNESQEHGQRLANEITAHKQTSNQLQSEKERAEAANSAKSRYLSGVSHELRTPLNTIFGYAQILEHDRQLAAKNHAAAVAIRRSGEHLADVIEGLLEISKIEAGRFVFQRETTALPMLLEQLVEMFSIQAHAKGIHFHYQCDDEIPLYVSTDEKRLRQILINLLSNAIKFTQQGQVEFIIHYRNQVAKFHVRDTGVGMDAADQARIFEPFERIRSRQTQHITGTGLGLAITRLLTEMLGGDINVTSQLGEGSCFSVSLMLAPVTQPTHRPANVEQRITGYGGPRKQIMLVDDEPAHRQVIVDLLSPLGFQVIPAQDAADCLQQLEGLTIDLFLLDVSMPQMNGWQLAQHLAQSGYAQPIIMLSANALEHQQAKLQPLPPAHYLAKPIRQDLLLNKIGQQLQLEWRYLAASKSNPAPPVSSPGFPRLPDEQTLTQLRQMAEIGYLSGILESLQQLELAERPATAFIQHVRHLADLCDLVGITQLLETCDQHARS